MTARREAIKTEALPDVGQSRPLVTVTPPREFVNASVKETLSLVGHMPVVRPGADQHLQHKKWGW